MMTEEINLHDDTEELNLPNHRFTQQAIEMDKQENLASSVLSSGQTDITLNLELFQEKQDEIERLQDLLEKKESELAETHKNVADLTENLKIAEERTSNALAEREKFAEKNRDNIHKIQNLKDQV